MNWVVNWISVLGGCLGRMGIGGTSPRIHSINPISFGRPLLYNMGVANILHSKKTFRKCSILNNASSTCRKTIWAETNSDKLLSTGNGKFLSSTFIEQSNDFISLLQTPFKYEINNRLQFVSRLLSHRRIPR